MQKIALFLDWNFIKNYDKNKEHYLTFWIVSQNDDKDKEVIKNIRKDSTFAQNERSLFLDLSNSERRWLPGVSDFKFSCWIGQVEAN